MQWTPGARPREDRARPIRGVLEALQERAQPFVDRMPEHSRPVYGSVLRSGAEMLPGVGDVVAVEDLQAAAQDNDWGGIGLGLLAAIPGIPAIGRGVRGEARAARRAGGLIADAAPARYADPSSGAIEVEVLPPEPDYPIRAYHGSPHSFDRFSLDKIGTGEGAQAYGHGLYFAESEEVARGYRDQLSDRGPLLNGRPVESDALRGAATRFRTVDDYVSAMEAKAEILRQQVVEGDDLDALITRADLSDAERRLEEARAYAGQEFGFGPQGSMYEVGINAHPDTFLDWDRPMAEQPESVRAALEDVLANVPGVRDNLQPYEIETGPSNGSNLMGAFSEARPGDYRTAMTDELRQRGVNGIRYLDGNSRGVGEGSSNYVVFNDELVKILRKYGITGLGLSGGAALGGGLIADQQQRPAPTGL